MWRNKNILEKRNINVPNLTEITDEMLKTGKEVTTALEEFMDFTGKDIIVGYNVNFDINFIYDKCERYLDTYLTNDFIDTMRIAKKCCQILPIIN